MQADCINAANISFYSDIITWLLVITGWVIINHQQNIRETRKELRSNLDEIKLSLISIEKKSIKYHMNDIDASLASEIKLSISRVSTEIKLLALLDKETQKTLIKTFRQAITLNNFDADNHVSYNYGSELILEISSTVDEISIALEQTFRNKYPR